MSTAPESISTRTEKVGSDTTSDEGGGLGQERSGLGWDWERAGDGFVEGAGLGAIAGVELGAAAGAPAGPAAAAVGAARGVAIGAIVGGVIGAVAKGLTGRRRGRERDDNE
jgi:phage tail tape-measure protein